MFICAYEHILLKENVKGHYVCKSEVDIHENINKKCLN